MRKRTTALLAAMTLALGATAVAQQETFSERLNKNRYPLTLQNGQMAGAGAAVLGKAIEDAQFLLVGEDHGIAQIPAIDAGLCDIAGPAGFHTMAIEVGPLAAANLEKWIRQREGRGELAAFNKQYPESIAFYDWSEDYELLSHCAGKATGGKFRLWGLDQELMGSSRWILTNILAQRPGPEATRQAQQLLRENDEAHAAAVKTGNPEQLWMLQASDQELEQFGNVLQKEGNETAQRLFEALLVSRKIYQENIRGNSFDSNRRRALLMKRTFLEGYREEKQAESRPPKVMFKFGAWHMFKGINPLRNNDLGNFVSELADQEGSQSIHIVVLGVKGSQLRFAGIGQPYQAATLNLAEDKDSDFLYLKPMFESMYGEGFTLFDLRAFRRGFKSLGDVDREMERLIFGYDFLVLVPNPTPSKAIEQE